MQKLLEQSGKKFRTRNVNLHIRPDEPWKANTSYVLSVSDMVADGGAMPQARFQSLDSLIAALKEHAGVTTTDYEQLRQTLEKGQSTTVSDLWLSDEMLKALAFEP